MSKQARKVLSFFLALIMAFQLVPVKAMAAEEDIVDLETELTAEPGIQDEEITLEEEPESYEEELVEEPEEEITDAVWEDKIAVVGENTSLREEQTKQFFLENNMMMAVAYPHAVHYELDGEWEEIDNRLIMDAAAYEVPSKPGEVVKEILGVEQTGELEEVTEEETSEALVLDESKEASLSEIPAEILKDIPEESVELNESIEAGSEEVNVSEIVEGTITVSKEPMNSQIETDAQPEPIEESPLEEEIILDVVVLDETRDEDTEAAEPEIDTAEPETETHDEEAVAAEIIAVEETVWENTANSLHIAFPETFGEYSRITVVNKGYTLQFRPEGIEETSAEISIETDKPESLNEEMTSAANTRSAVKYTEAYPGIELKYDLIGTELKESYIISSRENAKTELTTVISAPGLAPVLYEDGSIEFLDKENNLIFYIPAPCVYDEGTEPGSINTKLYQLSSGDYRIVYTLDGEWLNDDARIWPVTFDPTITTTSSNYIDDLYVGSGKPNQGMYHPSQMYVGALSQDGNCYAYIRINDLPTLPSSSIILDADLKVEVNPNANSGVNSNQPQVNARMVSASSWVNYSTVTWSTKPDAESDVMDFKILSNYSGNHYFDVTRAARKWYDGTAVNNGITLQCEPGTQGYGFGRVGSTTGAHGARLTIVYTNTNGLEDYWDYTAQDMDRAGTAHVQNFSGNLTVQRTDLSYSGARMPVSITFTYNLADRNVDIGYGRGWRCNYSQIIEKVQDSTSSFHFEWTDGDGTVTYFKQSNGVWTDEAGNGYTLTYSAQSNGNLNWVKITDKNGGQLEFNGHTQLIAMYDSYGNVTRITYIDYSAAHDHRIDTITDGAERVYQFNYSDVPGTSTDPNTLLTSIQYKGTGTTALETVTYNYSGYRMIKATYADGKNVLYDYDTSNRLLTISNILQASARDTLTMTYGSGTLVRTKSMQMNSRGSQVSKVNFAYGENSTTVTDHVGRWVTYQFNNGGNTTAVFNSVGQALYGRWAKDTSSSNRANQLLASSRLQDTIADEAPLSVNVTYPTGTPAPLVLDNRENLIQNASVETNLSGWTGTGTATGDGRVSAACAMTKLGSYAIKLVGAAKTAKRYSQTVTISGGVNGDIVTFGGWIKCATVALDSKAYTDPNLQSSLPRRAGIQVELFNGSTSVAKKYIPANRGVRDWQFLSGSVQATGAYTKAVYSFVYEYEANTAFFDGAQLFRERFEYIYNYDSNGNLTSVKDLQGRTTTYAYNSSQDLTGITLPGGGHYSYTYNSHHDVTQSVTPLGVTTTSVYNSYGGKRYSYVTGGSDGREIRTSTTYSDNGNLVTETVGTDRKITRYTNDTERSLVTSVKNPRWYITTYSYDVMRRLIESSCEDSTVTNTYTDGLLTGITHNNTDTENTTYTLSYTTANLPLSVKVGNRTLTTRDYYTGRWTVKTQSYGNGDYWKHEYDISDILTKRYTNVTATAGLGFVYTYNSRNQLARLEKKLVTISGSSVTWGAVQSIEYYLYNAHEQLIRVVTTDGSNHVLSDIQWTLDNNDNVTGETVRYNVNGTLRTQTYSYAYNADQQLTQTTYDNLKETITYDGYGRRSGKTVTRSGATRLQTGYTYLNVDNTNYTTEQIGTLTNTYNGTTLTHTYTYNANGSILTDTINGQTTEYTYDELERVKWEKNEAAGLAWFTTYDNGGNILKRTEFTYVNGETSNSHSINYVYGDSQWPDLLTSWNGLSITYDGIGNPNNYMGSTMEWQGGRQLKSVTRGNNILTFTYNDSGLRTEKTVGHVNDGPTVTQKYVWNGSRLMAEIGPEYSFYFNYNAIGEMIGFMYRVEDDGTGSSAETQYIFVKNQQGDVEKVIRSWDQTIVASYSYDAWGNPIEWSGPMAERNPIRYRGYYYDTETGFYYLQSRYYDPQTGRFINADGYVTTGQGLMSYNMFVYCSNNPVCFVDNNGAKPEYVLDMNEDGEDDCFVYSYSYTTGVFWWKKEHTGYVYLYRGVEKDYFENKNNWPEDFNIKSDLMVGDYTDQKNPNLYAYQAQNVKKRHRKVIVGLLFEYVSDYGIAWKRTERSVLSEWESHNVFAFASPRAQNIDFDEKEEGKSFGYYAKKAWDAFVN